MSSFDRESTVLPPKQARQLFRKWRQAGPLTRGNVKPISLYTTKPWNFLIWSVALILVSLIAATLFWAHHFPLYHVDATTLPYDQWPRHAGQDTINQFFHWVHAIAVGLCTAVLIWLATLVWPWLRLVLYFLRQRRIPHKPYWQRYGMMHRFFSLGLLAALLASLLNPHAAHGIFLHIRDWFSPSPLSTWYRFRYPDEFQVFMVSGLSWPTHSALVRFLLDWGIVWLVIALLTLFLPAEPPRRITETVQDKFHGRRGDFSLYLGLTTGKLVERRHGAAIAAKQRVTLSAEDAAKNILILGGIGEGKTTAVINGLLLQLLDQDTGGLIFDIKGSFGDTVHEYAALTKRTITEIGPGRQQTNLIAGLPPEVAARLLSSIFAMINGNNDNKFWHEQGVHLTIGTLGILSFLPEHYTLVGLRRHIFEKNFRAEVNTQIGLLDLNDTQRQELESYHSRLAMIDSYDDRVKNDINATISTAIGSFTKPELIDSFCHPSGQEPPLDSLLTGDIILVDMPSHEYGALNRVVYALIKLRWFLLMEKRRRDKNTERPIFFLCDEYQDLITADSSGGSLSDVNFWDKSRDTNAIGIISAQSMMSFYSAVGNQNLTDTILQNFRQRLCFKTEDERTLSNLRTIIGEVFIAHKSESKQTSHSTSGRGLDSRSQKSTSTSMSQSKQAVIDSQLVRNLEPNQAIALLNIEQRSMDDVIDMRPVRERNT